MNVCRESYVVHWQPRRTVESMPSETMTSSDTSLLVRVRAITANKITRNFTYYPVEELKGDGKFGVVSFTKPYPIPVMKHHITTPMPFGGPADPTPIGRVVNAKFVEEGRGGGYIEVTAKIVDPQAIEAIRDGRLMTVSIGHIPSRVECSICGANILEQMCPHERGMCYNKEGNPDPEGKVCYHVMRGIQAIELSFVNVPSDNSAVVVSMESAPVEHITVPSVSEGTFIAESWGGSYISKEVNNVQDEEGMLVPPSELWYVDVDAEVERIYSQVEAKLTAAQRRRLPDSAFCGPNRSFPAHDKAHVLAGLRLLGRAKLSAAQKARVRACLLRKARQLGMDTGKDKEGMVPVWVISPHGELREFSVEESPIGAIAEAADISDGHGYRVLLVDCADENLYNAVLCNLGVETNEGSSAEESAEVSVDRSEQSDADVTGSVGAGNENEQVESTGSDEAARQEAADRESGGVVSTEPAREESTSVLDSIISALGLSIGGSNEDGIVKAIVREIEELSDTAERLRMESEQYQAEIARLKEQVSDLQSELKEQTHQMLAREATMLAIRMGYPVAVKRSEQEVYDLFLSRSDEWLGQFIQDARSEQPVPKVTDVGHPIPVGKDVHEVNDGRSGEEAPHKSNDYLKGFKFGDVVRSILSSEVDLSEDETEEVFRLFPYNQHNALGGE
jgi:polyhydroxyalkanoate synthesis regulator phasin